MDAIAIGELPVSRRLQAGASHLPGLGPYLLRLASDEAMPEGHKPPRLDEVKCALLSLDELERDSRLRLSDRAAMVPITTIDCEGVVPNRFELVLHAQGAPRRR